MPKNDPRHIELEKNLELLGLTRKIATEPINAVQIEVRVGRLTHKKDGENDLVNIADVGFGVSQVLPVLMALLVAEPGQMVYLEQPELHLHPRAQVALAQVLADAAKRGVRVVAETHSSLLLLGVQTLIAQGYIDPKLVKMHWFKRGDDGLSKVTSIDPDEDGAFGDWPEDFSEVEMNAENSYLDAVEARHGEK